MKYFNHMTALFAALTMINSLNAELMLEDFESYLDTNALHADIFSFGSAAQAGKPSLAEGLGKDGSKAACFNLTWETGNNANMCFINLSPNTKNLSGYSEINSFLYLEAYPNESASTDAEDSAVASNPTIVKLAIEGNDGTIWQTRSVKAERPAVDSVYNLRFRLNTRDMERVEGSGSFDSVISNIKTVRLRFENSRRSGFRQDAYIDDVKAIQ